MSQLYSHQLYKPVFCTPAYMCVCTYSYICIHRYICTCINMFLHLNLHAIDHWQVVKHCIFLCGCVCGGKSLHLLISLALWRLPCALDLLCPVSQLSFQYVSVCAQLCLTLCNPLDYSLPGSSVDGISNKNTGEGCHFLLQGIFPTQRSNLRLLHLLPWQADSLPLSHLGSHFLTIICVSC